MSDRATVWRLPLSPVTLPEVVDAAETLVEGGRPAYLITANTNYAMLTATDPRLRDVNAGAEMVLADGKPLVWASRLSGRPVPERVAGSDLIFALCERAALRGFRVFFLGGGEGVAEQAARRLSALYPGLEVAGTASPPHLPLDGPENDALVARVRAARPDILFAALGQPKGEIWLSRWGDALGVPVSMQVGAALDFAAGRVCRAPVLLQRLGLEWAYRLWLEPARLAPRYARNAAFLLTQLASDLARGTQAADEPGLAVRSAP